MEEVKKEELEGQPLKSLSEAGGIKLEMSDRDREDAVWASLCISEAPQLEGKWEGGLRRHGLTADCWSSPSTQLRTDCTPLPLLSCACLHLTLRVFSPVSDPHTASCTSSCLSLYFLSLCLFTYLSVSLCLHLLLSPLGSQPPYMCMSLSFCFSLHLSICFSLILAFSISCLLSV